MNNYNVCGVLVMVAPQRAAEVEAALSAMEGVEIHANQNSRLVVTVEGPNDRDFANRINAFSDIRGVLSTSLVYHEIDTEDFISEPINTTAAPVRESLQ
jgi:nitrate reductase NapD